MNIDDCYKRRLLREGRPDPLKAEKALDIAELRLSDAKFMVSKGYYSAGLVYGYTAMFQSARSILFKDGIFERSHWCVVLYLKKEYVDKHLLEPKFISWLDTFRMERHQELYGLEPDLFQKADAKDALEKAAMFINEMKRLVNDD